MDASAEAAKRIVRTLKYSFILSGALFILVCYRIPSKSPHPASPALGLMLTAFALLDVAIGFLTPKYLATLAQRAPAGSQRSNSRQQWFSGCVLSLAFFTSSNLFALVLHFLNADVHLVELLFAVGMLSMILWSPGNPPGTDDGAITRY